jgi:hypothetical protein
MKKLRYLLLAFTALFLVTGSLMAQEKLRKKRRKSSSSRRQLMKTVMW